MLLKINYNFSLTAQNFKICLRVLRKGHGAKMYRVIYNDKKYKKNLQNCKRCDFREGKTTQWGFLMIFGVLSILETVL
jgi:hypothetical protein